MFQVYMNVEHDLYGSGGVVVPDGLPPGDLPLPISERLRLVTLAQLGSLHDTGLHTHLHPEVKQPVPQVANVIPLFPTKYTNQ